MKRIKRILVLGLALCLLLAVGCSQKGAEKVTINVGVLKGRRELVLLT